MGSGKTTTGKKVANKSGLDFFDLDEIIEQNTKKSINEIFSTLGEKKFREIEHEVFKNLIKKQNKDCIIASGGGLLEYEKNLKYVNKYCISIFLDLPWQIIKERLRNDNTRPLLKNRSMRTIYNLWQQRRKSYKKHSNFIIKVEEKNDKK